MLTGEKNRAQNCLTVPKLKLDDVFGDVFGKSARSISNYILEHPGETFDVSPVVDPYCKTPVSEIQADLLRRQLFKTSSCPGRQCVDQIQKAPGI